MLRLFVLSALALATVDGLAVTVARPPKSVQQEQAVRRTWHYKNDVVLKPEPRVSKLLVDSFDRDILVNDAVASWLGKAANALIHAYDTELTHANALLGRAPHL